jgi:hypothetical protein
MRAFIGPGGMVRENPSARPSKRVYATAVVDTFRTGTFLAYSLSVLGLKASDEQ